MSCIVLQNRLKRYVLSVLRHFYVVSSDIFTSQYYNESSAILCVLKYNCTSKNRLKIIWIFYR